MKHMSTAPSTAQPPRYVLFCIINLTKMFMYVFVNGDQLSQQNPCRCSDSFRAPSNS